MKKYILWPLMLVLSACAFSAPNGEKQLMEAIKADREKRGSFRDLRAGKPKLVKVRAYKQIHQGDIYGDHWIYLQVGREKLKIDDLIEGL